MLLQLLQLLLLLWKLKNRLVLGSVPSARHTDSKATDLFRYNSVDRIVDCDAVITNAKRPRSAFPILSREEAQKTNSLCSHHPSTTYVSRHQIHQRQQPFAIINRWLLGVAQRGVWMTWTRYWHVQQPGRAEQETQHSRSLILIPTESPYATSD